MKTDCYNCIFMRKVPGDCHISCINPDQKMTGNPQGIRNGWFFYPYLFDPIWRSKECDNFQEKQE